MNNLVNHQNLKLLAETAFSTRTSLESDVYSFGVVLLELMTGKKAIDPSFMGNSDVVNWVRSTSSDPHGLETIVDPALRSYFSDPVVRKEVLKVLLVALKCTEKEPSSRPAMREVVKKLIDVKPGWLSSGR